MASLLLIKNILKIVTKLKMIKKCMMKKSETDRNPFFKNWFKCPPFSENLDTI